MNSMIALNLSNLARRLAAFAATGFLAAASSVSAAVLITVDVTDPAAVIFSTTLAPADVADSSTTTEDGVTLLEFFTADFAGSAVPDGNLRTRGEQRYNRAAVNNAPGSDVDLNFYRNNGTETQDFNTTQPDFRGSSTLDFTGFETFLPSVGMTGSLLAGWSGNPAQIIGEWTVVPEVSTCAQAGVMGLALAGWLVWRHRGMPTPQA